MPYFSHIKTKQKSSWLYFPNSYHPISLFPFVAKLKRVVYTQYYKFFSLSLSWNNPVRFSPNNSPESALVKIDKRLLNPTFSAQSSPSLTLIQHLTQMITASSLIHFLPSHTLPDFPATSLYLFSFLCWLLFLLSWSLTVGMLQGPIFGPLLSLYSLKWPQPISQL